MTTDLTITPLVPYGHQSHASAGETLLENVVDTLNPLQHLPFISHIYREATGDTASMASKIIGGGLFGGIIGAASSFVTASIEEASGTSLIETAKQALMSSDNQNTSILYGTSLQSSTLQPDQGEAFVSMIQSGAFTKSTVIELSSADNIISQADVSQPTDFRELRDPAMGLTDNNKQKQLQSSLHKLASDLI